MESIKTRKNLVIVESPSKAKHITEYLKTAGFTHTTVIASVGHISNLKDNTRSYKNTGIFPDDGFRLNIAVTEDKHDVVETLKHQVSKADYVYLMTDGDREGEAIAWSLVKFLKLKPEKCFRAITHEITPKAVVNAIENPVALDDNLVQAAHARMAIDKLVGYSLTPIAKSYIGARSVGRCQSAGLKLVVDREKEIQDFIPETYYDLYLNFSKNGTNFKAKYVGTYNEVIQHLKSTDEVKLVKLKCTDEYMIKNIDKKTKSESPKPPFCTATFQQEAANKLGLKVKDAMSIAQKLFESGKITYHRTDDVSFSPEFVAILKPYVENTFKNYTAARKSKATGTEQNGHECLRITDPALTPEDFNKTESNQLHQKVYNLIWCRTIAAVLPNAKISETIYNIYNNDQKFTLTSNEIIDEGYRIIYKSVEEKEADLVKETFSENEILQDCMLEDIKKQTTPPPRYTEASLVKELQTRAIGRPSTFATIVETVLSPTRNYAKLEDKKIVPTELGIQLSHFLDRSFSDLINLNYTKELEEELDEISVGNNSYLNFITKFYNDLDTLITNNKELCKEPNNQAIKVCPKCGSPMVIRRSRYGRLFYGCSTYPQCTGIIDVK